VRPMLSLALALQLALAAPVGGPTGAVSLSPRLDPGPFRSGELALASVGVLGGDALVLGGGYLALTMFANGTLQTSAGNFRTAAYALGVAALVVPPLTAVLLARVGARGPLAGAFWKALLLATAGEAAALAAGYVGAPHFWLILPVQLAAVTMGTSWGLHWGPRDAPPIGTAPPPLGGEPRDATTSPPAAALFLPICPDA
jgi:hypothetical protein